MLDKTLANWPIKTAQLRVLLMGILSVVLLTGKVYAQVEADDFIEEVLVTSKRQGPPLWQVTKAGNVLWIFGVVTVTPEDFSWDDSSVKDILGESEVYITQPIMSARTSNPFKIVSLSRRVNRYKRLPDEQSLIDVLPEDLYQRFLAIKNTYRPKDKTLLLRKPRVAALELYQQVLNSFNLNADAGQRTRRQLGKMAKRKKVPIQSLVEQMKPGDLLDALEAQPFVPNTHCLTTVLDSIEHDLENMANRAIRWSQGDASGFRSIKYPDVDDACQLPLPDVIGDIQGDNGNAWLGAGEKALQGNTVSFASLSVYDIAREGGLLDLLRRKGYQVAIK